MFLTKALFISPELGQRRFHHVPLGFVDIVREFNEGGQVDERCEFAKKF